MPPSATDDPATRGVESSADAPSSNGASSTAALPPRPDSPATPRPSLDQLSDMTGEQVTELLGKPQFLRGETSVELWQYRAQGCVVNLFLYRAGEGLRVRHAEVRSRLTPGTAPESRVASGPAASDCLAKLAAAQAGVTS